MSAMIPAETLAPPTEEEKVCAWRLHCLLEAGYPLDDAADLASRTDVDLRRAVALLEDGCPVRLAVRILA